MTFSWKIGPKKRMVNSNAPTQWQREVQRLTSLRNRLVTIEGIPPGASEQWNIRLQAYSAFAGHTCGGKSLAYFATATRANHFIARSHEMQFMGSTVTVTNAKQARLAEYLREAAVMRRVCQDKNEQFHHF